MDNKAIERAAQLLLDGATMLQESCPQCSSPLYRKKDGSLFCGTCNSPVIREEEAQQIELQKKESMASSPIKAKIEMLGEQLAAETDLQKIQEIAKTIKYLEDL